MFTGLGDSRSRRADYRVGQISLFRTRLRNAGVPEPQVQDAIAALEADLRTIDREENPTWGEYQDEVARLVGLHERRQMDHGVRRRVQALSSA